MSTPRMAELSHSGLKRVAVRKARPADYRRYRSHVILDITNEIKQQTQAREREPILNRRESTSNHINTNGTPAEGANPEIGKIASVSS